MMSNMNSTEELNKSYLTRGEITRDALVQAALEVFGRDGFNAASTRDIAKLAGTNQALINYHFKGKQGLYLAVFEHIASQMMQGVGNIASSILEEIPNIVSLPQKEKNEFAIQGLEQLCSRLIHMMNSDVTKHWSSMLLREQQHPTAAFDIMHKGPMGKLLKLSSQLIAMATNIDADSEAARLQSVLIFGQIHVLKVSRATLLSHMQWDEFSENEMQIAEQKIFSNIRAMLNTDV